MDVINALYLNFGFSETINCNFKLKNTDYQCIIFLCEKIYYIITQKKQFAITLDNDSRYLVSELRAYTNSLSR